MPQVSYRSQFYCYPVSVEDTWNCSPPPHFHLCKQGGPVCLEDKCYFLIKEGMKECGFDFNSLDHIATREKPETGEKFPSLRE